MLDQPLIERCAAIPLKRVADERGQIRILENLRDGGFCAKRVFLIEVESDLTGISRANHATSGTQLIVPLAGSYRLALDNGEQKQSFSCRHGDPGILVGAGVWRSISDMVPGTTILVAAEETYDETRYFDRAVPENVAREKSD